MATIGRGLRQAIGALRSPLGEHGVAPWVCPECGKEALRRSHAVSWVEHVGRAVRLRVYRCHVCQHRQFHLHVASADELARRGTVPQQQPQLPQPTREARARAGIMPAIAAVASGVRGVGKLARHPYWRIRLRTFLVVSLLVALLGGAVGAVASHGLLPWQRGKEVVSIGYPWWAGARDRVFAVASDLKLLWAPPTPAPEPVAATEPAAPPKKKTPPAKRRTHTVAKPAANAAAVAQAHESAVGGVAWRAARWGMTVEEVLAAFPSEAVRSRAEVDSSRSLAERAAIERTSLGTVTGRVSFLFGSDGRLAAIAATPHALRDAAQTYRDLGSWLSGELGWPTTRDSRITAGWRVDASDWRTPDTAVHLSVAQTAQQDARVLALDLGSGEIHALPQRVDLWYEPARSAP